MKINRNRAKDDAYVMFSGTKAECEAWLNEIFQIGKNEFSDRRAMMNKNYPNWDITEEGSMNYEIIRLKKGRKVNYYFYHPESGGIWSTRTNYYGKTFPVTGYWKQETISSESAPKWVKKKWNEFIRES